MTPILMCLSSCLQGASPCALAAALPQREAAATGLRRLLQSHPEHLEARVKLLHRLRQDAENQARERFEELDATEDLRIWSAWAQELDRLLSTPGWQGDSLPLLSGLERPLERTSPLVRTLFQRRLPDVEQALRQWPDHRDSWSLWLWMHRILGRTPRPDTLTALPLTSITRASLAPEIPGLAPPAPPPMPEARPLALLVLEGEDPSHWKPTLLALADAPSLAAWNLPVIEVLPDAPLRKLISVPTEERCWLLVDAGLRSVAKGFRCPDLGELERALASSGHCPRLERMAQEATTSSRWEAYLAALAETAIRSTRRLLELPPESIQPEDGPLSDQELPEEGDPWQTYAECLLRFLQEPSWAGGEPGRTQDPLCPPGREASPTLRRRAPHILRYAAARLQQHPTSDRAWRLWLAYAPMVEGTSLSSFLKTLLPVPGATPWPPPRAAQALAEEVRRETAWVVRHCSTPSR